MYKYRVHTHQNLQTDIVSPSVYKYRVHTHQNLQTDIVRRKDSLHTEEFYTDRSSNVNTIIVDGVSACLISLSNENKQVLKSTIRNKRNIQAFRHVSSVVNYTQLLSLLVTEILSQVVSAHNKQT